MKNIRILILLLISAIACKAQKNPPAFEPQLPLDTKRYNIPSDHYIKDTNGVMNKFIGTWQFTLGNSSLTIRLAKKEHVPDGDYFEDMIVGEFKYIDNGTSIVNTLQNANFNSNVVGDYHIGGNIILKADDYMYPCNNCNTNEHRFKLSFDDPERHYLHSSIIIRYLTNENNPEKIEVQLLTKQTELFLPENAPTTPRVPYGTYILSKLP